MKDLHLKRLVHVAAVSSLALVTVGCGDSKTRTARKYCKSVKKTCDLASEELDVGDCVDSKVEDIDEMYDISDACGAAYVDDLECNADAEGGVCGDEAEDCDREEVLLECYDYAL